MLKGLGIKNTVTQYAHLIPGIGHVLAQAPESKVCEKGNCAVAFHSLQSQHLITPYLSGLNPKCNLHKYTSRARVSNSAASPCISVLPGLTLMPHRRDSLHTSQISHLLLYPSLWLLVPGLSGQFLPLFLYNMLLMSAVIAKIFEKWLQDFCKLWEPLDIRLMIGEYNNVTVID